MSPAEVIDGVVNGEAVGGAVTTEVAGGVLAPKIEKDVSISELDVLWSNCNGMPWKSFQSGMLWSPEKSSIEPMVASLSARLSDGNWLSNSAVPLFSLRDAVGLGATDHAPILFLNAAMWPLLGPRASPAPAWQATAKDAQLPH